MHQTPPPSDSSHAPHVIIFFRRQTDGQDVLLERHWTVQFQQGEIVVKYASHIVGVHKNLPNIYRQFKLRLEDFRHFTVAQPYPGTDGGTTER